MRRGPARLVLGALTLTLLGAVARGAPPAGRDLAGERQKALARDADDLRRLARAADEMGLARTADADWALVLSLAPDDPVARKRLGWLRRGKEWVHDAASFALASRAPDARPGRRDEYLARRHDEFERPSAARHRDLAVAHHAAGRPDDAEAALRLALARDPGDVLARLARAEVPDPVEGWVPDALRRRRVAAARAEAEAYRLLLSSAVPTRDDVPGPRSAAVEVPLTVWRLRGLVLETDLPDEVAAEALAAADLGLRWFRRFVAPGPDDRLLPGPCRLVVLSSAERYRKAVDAEEGLSAAVKAFARSVSAVPLPRAGRAETVVLIEREEVAFARDACLHYVLHVLFRERFAVEAEEAWLYEGLAAYVTFRVLSTQASWCIAMETTTAGVPMRAPHPETWAEQAVELAHRREDEPLRRLVGASLNELDGPMLVKAWSFLRLLIEDHPDEARRFLEARSAGGGSAAALRAATGLALEDLDLAWRLAVLSGEGE